MMQVRCTRRSFIAGAAAMSASATLPSFASTAHLPGLRYGYAAMPWGTDERKAIEDIAATGYPGVQFRANAVTDFQAPELKDLLAERKLTFVALSSGTISLDAPAGAQIDKHFANAKFVKEAGGHYLQILDELKTHPRTATSEDCKKLGLLLAELGKRTSDIGIPLGYHNHLNTLSEMPHSLEQILENSDPKYVGLELDTAHLTAGGGDPAKEIVKYRDRLLFMHLKDVHAIPADTPHAAYPFEFVELGRGTVDFPAIFQALEKIRYHGWAVVELDREPDKTRTPKTSAELSKMYLEQKIGVVV